MEYKPHVATINYGQVKRLRARLHGEFQPGLKFWPTHLAEISLQLVYVIGLHAVQFGNNWMRKIPRTAKLDEAIGQFGLVHCAGKFAGIRYSIEMPR